ncbi:MAG: TonB family protein [Bacteroidia bacterium]|nr:TonB family protein [Bacteroidia bacterium]
MNGTYFKFHKDGTFSEEGFYENDTLTGIRYQYATNKISSQRIYLDKKTNLAKYINYKNGTDTIITQGFYRGETKDSCWIYYSESGNKKRELFYKNGKKTGYRKDYFENGKLEKYTEYKNETEEGLKFTLSAKGDTLSKYFMKNGNRNGIYSGIERTEIPRILNWPLIQLKVVGNFSENKKHGRFQYFYPNGKIAMDQNYTEGKLSGERMVFDSLGNKLTSTHYLKGKLNGDWTEWYASGKKRREAHFDKGKQNGREAEYFENEKTRMEAIYSNNKIAGNRIFYYENGKPKVKEIYKDGILTEQISYDAKGKTKRTLIKPEIINEDKGIPQDMEGETEDQVAETADNIYTIAEQMPEFQGGDAAMFKFLQKNINYPQMEKENGIQGKCYIQFVVTKDGEVEDIKVLRGVPGGPGCDKEAVRVVKLFPKFKPGLMNGKPVSVRYNLPIKFSLQ